MRTFCGCIDHVGLSVRQSSCVDSGSVMGVDSTSESVNEPDKTSFHW